MGCTMVLVVCIFALDLVFGMVFYIYLTIFINGLIAVERLAVYLTDL